LLDFFLLSSIHSEFQLLYFETKANTFLFGTSYVHQYTQDFIMFLSVWYVQDFITKTYHFKIDFKRIREITMFKSFIH
jgi:hypothetical protein